MDSIFLILVLLFVYENPGDDPPITMTTVRQTEIRGTLYLYYLMNQRVLGCTIL